jgi:hypothetical protein
LLGEAVKIAHAGGARTVEVNSAAGARDYFKRLDHLI